MEPRHHLAGLPAIGPPPQHTVFEYALPVSPLSTAHKGASPTTLPKPRVCRCSNTPLARGTPSLLGGLLMLTTAPRPICLWDPGLPETKREETRPTNT